MDDHDDNFGHRLRFGVPDNRFGVGEAPVSDSGDDEDMNMDDVPALHPGLGHRPRDVLPLHHVLRLIAQGRRFVGEEPAGTNEELVNNLRRHGTIATDGVFKVMRICARGAFVPPEYRDQAYVDSPIRLEEFDFNVSAPHMHATCLEALKLQNGQRVLDVGSGCGVLTACMAMMVGKSGAVVGIDVKRDAVQLAKDNVKRLIEDNAEYASEACHIKFEVHNVFLPSLKHKGSYDRVHVGASCLPSHLCYLLALLKPSGGLIVTPVWQNDLRLITKKSDGTVVQKVLSHVRYGELEVPSDMDILLASMELERKARTRTMPKSSTFAQDMSDILGELSGSSSGSLSDEALGLIPATPSPDNRRWGVPRLARLFSACSRASGSSSGGSSPRSLSYNSTYSEGGMRGPLAEAPWLLPPLDPRSLGPADCRLQGNGWQLEVHRCVLCARCPQWRARCSSGMRDADAHEITCPEHFSQAAVAAFLHYLYNDCLPPDVDPQKAVALLHVAHYYGADRLVSLCEVLLADELRGRDAADEAAMEAAPLLLALADENGLEMLKALVLDCLVHSGVEESVRKKAFAQLTHDQLALVACEAINKLNRVQQITHELRNPVKLPEP